MRKLVTIQEIKDIVPIEGADAIELVKILGWQCVAKKGEFNKGDKAVYFEVDAFLPVDDKRYEFLVKSSYKKNEIMGEGLRIRSQKFRGALSQGLALPVSAFPELNGYDVDVDVSEVLGVKKWDMPEVQGSSGTMMGGRPFGIPQTDETRIQSIDALRQQLLGKGYYISTKMDGTSCTMFVINDRDGVCGRNYEYKDDGKCSMWTYAHERKVIEGIRSLNRNLVIQGEFCGEGIQKNRLRLKKPAWYVFNILDGNTMKLLCLDEMLEICEKLNLDTVPIEERGDCFNYTLEELLERARGKYPSGLDKEGIVIRPLVPEFCTALGKELSFKVLNNDFLLKEK